MRCYATIAAVVLMAGSLHAEPVRFTQKPAISPQRGARAVAFAVSAATDVEVAIIDRDGRVVRHLAAGAISDEKQAPVAEPLQPGLRQQIAWDGTDDAGKAVADSAGPYVARVRIGLAAALDRVIGYSGQTIGDVKCVAVDPTGRLFCLNGYSVPSLQVFDRDGRYIRTLLPHDPKRGGGIPTLTRDDGIAVPFLRNARDPYVELAALGVYGLRATGSMTLIGDRVLIAGNGNGVVWLGQDGNVNQPMRGPAVLPAGWTQVTGLAASGDGKTVFAAGIGPNKVRGVFSVSLNQEPVQPRQVLDGDAVGESGGLAVDRAGRLYVADIGGTVRIFDKAGKPAGQFAVERPIDVAVHSKTGAVYVLAMQELVKFTGPDAQKPTWSLPLPKVAGGPRTVFALDGSAETPVLWIGATSEYSPFSLWRVEDLGDGVGKPVEISDRGRVGMSSPVHVAADPARDEVYVREWRGSWRGPLLTRFDGKTGQRTDLNIRGSEYDVGPDGLLYVRCFRGGEVGSWIHRYDRDDKVVPFAKAAPPLPSKDPTGLWVLDSLRGATAVGMKGFDVAPNGDIYVLRYFSARGGKGPWVKEGFKFPEHPPGVDYLTPLIDVYSSDGELKTSGIVKYFQQGAAGVRVARDGSIYVADHIRPVDQPYLPHMAAQLPPLGEPDMWDWPHGPHNWYLFNYGTLFKFGPAGGTISPADAGAPGAMFAGTRGKNLRYATVNGVIWKNRGISPVPADTNRGHGGGCVCTNGRFDLDGFGRLFVPDACQFRVLVLDAAGNRIASFGRYGNVDDASGQIVLNWASFVTCSRDAIYLADNLNRRLLRVVLRHAAEESVEIR